MLHTCCAGRRRSTRSVQRYGHSEDEPSASVEEEADDPEANFQLSDSDDDPDFAPATKKVSNIIYKLFLF